MVVGSATVRTHKEGETETQRVRNKLSTNLAAKQKLIFTWERGESKFVLTKLTSATCVVSPHKKFTGKGEGTVNGEAATVSFSFSLTPSNAFTFHISMKVEKEPPIRLTMHAARLTSETIS